MSDSFQETSLPSSTSPEPASLDTTSAPTELPANEAVEIDLEEPRGLHPWSPGILLVTQVFEFFTQSLLGLLILALGIYRGLQGSLEQVFSLLLNLLPLGLFLLAILLRSVIRVMTLNFWVEEGELVIRSGLLHRQHRRISLDRVQNIELIQKLPHRFLGVAEVRIETAGASESEAELEVLSLEDARLLQSQLRRAGQLRNHRRSKTTAAPGLPVTELAEETEEANCLYRLSLFRLMLVGAMSKRIPGLVLVSPFLASQLFPVLGLEWRSWAGGETFSEVAFLSFCLSGLLLLGAVLMSIAAELMQHYRCQLLSTPEGLVLESGLFTRKQTQIPLAKIQLCRLDESFLHQLLNLGTLAALSAGRSEKNGEESRGRATLPLVSLREVPQLVGHFIPAFREVQWPNTFQLGHPAAQRRAIVRSGILLGLPWVLLAKFLTWWLLLVLFPVLALAVALGILHYRHVGYHCAKGFLMVQRGFFHRTTWLLPAQQIQGLLLQQTPFQRRYGLGSLILTTAAGPVQVPDLLWEDARQLQEALAHQVHQAGLEW